MRFDDAPPVSTPPPRMRVSDLLRELSGAILSYATGEALAIPVSGVHHDSRAVEPGDVFVARAGAKTTGLAFVEDAVRRGAVVVIAARGAITRNVGVPVIEVDDVPLALAIASSAVYGHPTFGLDVVGVTGTNGKTTTTLLVRAMLEAAEQRPGTIGTLGYELAGVFSRPASHTSPEADDLARLAREMRDKGATHLVMEVSSIGLAAKRTDGVRFRVASFTNLTQDHLDYHGTMEAYGAAKVRLFGELGPASAAVHVGDPFGAEILRALLPGTRVLRYSVSPDKAPSDVFPKHFDMGPRGIHLVASTPRGEIEIDSRLVGAHNVENLLGAIAIGLLLELPSDAIARGLSGDVRVSGRLERCDDPSMDDVVVLVDYAHTPDALARVLASVRAFSRGKVRTVFGCGGDRDPGKRPIMGEAAGKGSDFAILTNDNPRSEDPRKIADDVLPGLVATSTPFVVELDRAKAIEHAVTEAEPGDVILVAGKGHETYQILGPKTYPFDDREEARRALELRRNARGQEA